MTNAANCNDPKARRALALGLSSATVWDMLKLGELAAKRLRGRTLVPREELMRVLGEAPAARAA